MAVFINIEFGVRAFDGQENLESEQQGETSDVKLQMCANVNELMILH